MFYIFIIVVIFVLMFREVFLDKSEPKPPVICYIIDLVLRISKYLYVIFTRIKK